MRDKRPNTTTEFKTNEGDFLFYIVAFIIISFFIFGCAAKQQHHTATNLKTSDTLIIKNERVISSKGSYTLQLHEICDTITGEPIVFTQYITRGNDSIKLMIDKLNGLTLTIENKETVISDLQTRIEKLQSQLKEREETVVTRFKTPKWAWYTLIFTLLGIAYILNRFFKWIPFV